MVAVHSAPSALSRVALVLAGLGLAACASFRTIDPAAVPVALREGEGILIVHVQTDIAIDTLRASGKTVAGPLKPGEHWLAVAAKEGRYRWSDYVRHVGYLRVTHSMYTKREEFAFRVVAGKVSYPGRLEIVGDYGGRVVNQPFESLPLLQKHFPELLAHYPIRYTGPDSGPVPEP